MHIVRQAIPGFNEKTPWIKEGKTERRGDRERRRKKRRTWGMQGHKTRTRSIIGYTHAAGGSFTHAIKKIKKITCFIYTVSCVPAAKVNHYIPCFSIRWKSKGSLFINCLTLILSWSLIITALGKSISSPLKVTVTSFQSISSVSHK